MQEIITKEEQAQRILIDDVTCGGLNVIGFRASTGAVCVLIKDSLQENSWYFKSLRTPLQNNGTFEGSSARESVWKAKEAGRVVMLFESQVELAKFILDGN